ncbi:hypothetical protein [Streptococcus parauberis]|uniref:hypothetical protein n=1 Tax=Streptococcus parauberis TaxID=1348 RepID=UPI000789B285|nr:hypothetical protein [Streptococcus parauberis]KYP17741.1 hypothetical protein TN39_01952 [Streptococcus parauberis]KYP18604.1 hypothetical protein AKL14_00890 [Streptococcus parauberis]KYP20007.1 hypothetical protein AKL13_00807 [Streptococcus parauberis]KYP27338.1 hypothetical protein TM50_00644 [Streptococcus parauberis]KYP27604.1 hypothetical protein TP84_00473 [Streptococcus parauberis]
MFDEDVMKAILELRDVMWDDKVASFCINNNIIWSDTAMAGSPTEVIGQARDLLKYLIKEM